MRKPRGTVTTMATIKFIVISLVIRSLLYAFSVTSVVVIEESAFAEIEWDVIGNKEYTCIENVTFINAFKECESLSASLATLDPLPIVDCLECSWVDPFFLNESNQYPNLYAEHNIDINDLQTCRNISLSGCLIRTDFNDATPNYQFTLPEIPEDIRNIHFRVKATNDVHIALTKISQAEPQQEAYEIVIGGISNTQSMIKRQIQGIYSLVSFEHEILDPAQLIAFWISFADGNIHVGRLNEQPFLIYEDLFPLDVRYIGYATAYGSSGEFDFCDYEKNVCKADVKSLCINNEGSFGSSNIGRRLPGICERSITPTTASMIVNQTDCESCNEAYVTKTSTIFTVNGTAETTHPNTISEASTISNTNGTADTTDTANDTLSDCSTKATAANATTVSIDVISGTTADNNDNTTVTATTSGSKTKPSDNTTSTTERFEDFRRIYEEYKQLELKVLSEKRDILIYRKKSYETENRIGMAEIHDVSGGIYSNNLTIEENDVQVTLKIHQNVSKGEVLIITEWIKHDMKYDVVEDAVIIGDHTQIDHNIRYLSHNAFSCSVYNTTDWSSINKTDVIFSMNNIYPVSDESGTAMDFQPVCVYYDENKFLLSDSKMSTSETSSGDIECSANHLTSFSVLVKITAIDVKTGDDFKATMTDVCGAMSLIALMMVLIVHCLLTDLWKSLRNSIHKNLIVNIIVMQCLFLFGIRHANNTTTCTAVAIILHLSFLNTFTWMSAEAVFLMLKLDKSIVRYNQLRHYLMICYGIPSIVVGVSIVCFYLIYGQYDKCYLNKDTGMIWAFTGPAILLVTLTSIGMINLQKAVRSTRLARKSKTEQDKLKKLKSLTKGMLVMLPIICATWLTGLYAISSDEDYLTYIFNLLNVCQGICIFLVCCLFDMETQQSFQNRGGNQTPVTSITVREMESKT